MEGDFGSTTTTSPKFLRWHPARFLWFGFLAAKNGNIVDLKNLDFGVFLVPGYLEDYGKKFLHYKRWPGGLVNTLVVVI